MSYEFNKKTGEISISGWESGIAPSPHAGNLQGGGGVADLKNVNISSIRGEVSVAYNRVRQDQPQITAQAATFSNSSPYFGLGQAVQIGTWIQVSNIVGSNSGLTTGHYYQVNSPTSGGNTYSLTSDFGTTVITSSGTGTFTYTTVAMGAPIDYCTEYQITGIYRYYILDANGIVWVSGTATSVGQGGRLTTSTIWSAINPSGTALHPFDSAGNQTGGSVAIMYASANNVITATYLVVCSTNNLYILKTSDASGWPSNTGSSPAGLGGGTTSFNYIGAPHKAIYSTDQVMYITDGPTITILQQAAGKTFDPATSNTYNYTHPAYLLNPTDVATRIIPMPAGNTVSILVGCAQNNLYIFPSYLNSAASNTQPITILWLPEGNVQYLLQANNYVIIFAGNKGNIYLTNGSSVVPILTIPDYVAGSANFVQDPYFTWLGAGYLRGRIFCSLQDSTASHTGNCGGVWSFAPSFSYYAQQDSGLSLRMEAASSQYSTQGYNGGAVCIFGGSDNMAQAANGPQYVAAWTQTNINSVTTNSIDFSGTNPRTDGSSLIETDAVPVGTFLEKETFDQIEIQFASKLVSGESVVVKYRTDLEATWTTAGTITSENFSGVGDGSQLSQIILGTVFQKVQIIQLQILLTSTVSSPSWCRVKNIYIR